LNGKERLASSFGSGIGICVLFLYPMALAAHPLKKHWRKIGVRVDWIQGSGKLNAGIDPVFVIDCCAMN